jgi:hypothetical protein
MFIAVVIMSFLIVLTDTRDSNINTEFKLLAKAGHIMTPIDSKDAGAAD